VGTARSRDVKTNGSALDREAIAKVINEHLHELSSCYERAMITDGAFGGRMLLEWQISPPGAVTSSRVKQSDIKNATFGACVLARLNAWKFPAAKGPSLVTYPLLLDHKGF
jgi:hypothetical protein